MKKLKYLFIVLLFLLIVLAGCWITHQKSCEDDSRIDDIMRNLYADDNLLYSKLSEIINESCDLPDGHYDLCLINGGKIIVEKIEITHRGGSCKIISQYGTSNIIIDGSTVKWSWDIGRSGTEEYHGVKNLRYMHGSVCVDEGAQMGKWYINI